MDYYVKLSNHTEILRNKFWTIRDSMIILHIFCMGYVCLWLVVVMHVINTPPYIHCNLTLSYFIHILYLTPPGYGTLCTSVRSTQASVHVACVSTVHSTRWQVWHCTISHLSTSCQPDPSLVDVMVSWYGTGAAACWRNSVTSSGEQLYRES